jgi:lipoyl(octanoyl) transferase
MTARPAMQVVDLGVCAFAAAWARQLEEVERRKGGEVDDDLLLLVEHPHVITVGRSRSAAANVLAPGDVPVVEIERGGDATYHGPGQLVAYPVLRLRDGERDLHRFLRNLEEAMLRTLARWGLEAGREPGKTGVWLTDAAGARRKIASIGIACRRWVTFHGLALNVTTDLAYFGRINPCGFEASVMTSMAAELGAPPAMADVKRALADDLAATLGRAAA